MNNNNTNSKRNSDISQGKKEIMIYLFVQIIMK